jgi:hypothetical protein
LNPKRTRCFLLPALLFLILLIISSCKKDPYEIGINLLPSVDTLGIKSSDTASIIAYSELQDSIRSDRTTTFLLGSLMDPVFGSSTANFYTQLDLSTTSYNFGQSPVLDSVVLMLQYDGYYGDSTALQSVKVYELSGAISPDSAYHTNNSIATYPTLLASKTFRPAIHDSVTVLGEKLAPHLRINLNKLTRYFGNKLLNAPASSMADNTAFSEYMQGLCIKSERAVTGGGFVIFNPLATLTKLVLYYHNQDVGDSLHYDYLISSSTGRFNQVDHNGYLDANPEFRMQVINHDTTLGKNQLYLQGLGGVRVKLRFPHIRDFIKQGPVALNNVLLVIKNVSSDTSLAPPPTIELMKIDSVGYTSFLIDETISAAYYGGTYNKAARTYSFRITRYIQSILQGTQTNLDLYLTVNNPLKSLLDPNRIVVSGTNPLLPLIKGDRLQLQVTYTKIR